MIYSKVRSVSVTLDGTSSAALAIQLQGEKGFRIMNPALPAEEGGTGQKIYLKVYPNGGTVPDLADMQAGDVTAILWPGQMFSVECFGQSIIADVDSDTLETKIEVLS